MAFQVHRRSFLIFVMSENNMHTCTFISIKTYNTHFRKICKESPLPNHLIVLIWPANIFISTYFLFKKIQHYIHLNNACILFSSNNALIFVCCFILNCESASVLILTHFNILNHLISCNTAHRGIRLMTNGKRFLNEPQL